MNFVKSNKIFFLLIALFGINFVTLQFVSCNSSSEIESTISLINKENQSIRNLHEEVLLYEGLEEEILLAKEDLLNLSRIEKTQNRFWDSLLNKDDNLFINFKDKSSESINADLTKLYSNLRNLCTSKNVLFPAKNGSSNSFSPFGSSEEDTEKKFGFGLQSYDGFWPSFSKEEAKLLGVQSIIISRIVEYLANSTDEKYSITLNKMTRESVGKEDILHIADDKIDLISEENLIRNSVPIKSFAFSISFKSHTSHARSFINQLRPPFLIRDLKVERSVGTDYNTQSDETVDPFGDASKNLSQPLPIVSDVESTFYLTIEYVYMIDRDFGSFIKANSNSFKSGFDQETMNTLLETSGHSKLTSNLQKIFDNRENN